MVLYTEDFKKQVVKKMLSPGMVTREICKKLTISESAAQRWKKLYQDEVGPQIQSIDLDFLLYEPPVDVEELLREADKEKLTQASGSEALAQQVDQIRRKGKDPSQYTDAEKYALVMSLRVMSGDQQGVLLRQLGLQGAHIRLWEEQLMAMSKKPITTDIYTKQLEDENKRLKKQLSESERDVRELKILIELKKKFPSLFQQDGDKS
jgi:transposase-like protein